MLNYTTDGTYTQVEALGKPILVTDPVGNQTHLRYDSRGNLVSNTDALGITTTQTYNIADQPLITVFPATGQSGSGNGRAEIQYQYLGGAVSTVKVYNEALTLIRQVSYTYGQEGEPLSVSGDTPEPVAYGYDAMYRVNTLTDANGNNTAWNYAVIGYLTSVVLPQGETVSYTHYNNAWDLTTMTDARGIVANFAYVDPDGNLTAVTHPAYPVEDVTYTYDGYGRLSGKTDQAGTETYAYGDSDELTQRTVEYVGVPAKTLGRSYYPDGSVQSITTPAGTFTYQYSLAGWLTALTNPFSENTEFTYLENGWLKTQQSGKPFIALYTYNALGQLTTLTNIQRGGNNETILSSFTGMTYDGVGNRLGVTADVPSLPSLSGATTYAYTINNRLTQEASARLGGYTNNYAYDAAGNPTTFKGQARTYNSKNQLTGGTGLAGSFAYDGEGNSTTYNGQTIAFDTRDCATAFGSNVTAGYDSNGLRVWKQSTETFGRTYFLYDGGVPVCELSSVGLVTATNTWGANGLISRRTGTSSVLYAFDERGNTVQRLNTSGNVLSSRMADAYGTSGGSRSTGDPYDGFGAQWGYYTDKETGLILCTYRYYDPATGRWINRDPIGYDGGINLYSYCANNPVNAIDPSGLKVDIVGCTPAEKNTVLWALGKIRATKRGKELAKKFDDPNVVYKIVKLTPKIANDFGYYDGSFSDTPNKAVYISFTSHPLIPTDWGMIVRSSLLRTITHELAHSVTGTPDSGKGRMDNVNANENPIMSELGYPKRTKYSPDGSEMFGRIIQDHPDFNPRKKKKV